MNDLEPGSLIREVRRRYRREELARARRMSVKSGVPDPCLFRRGDTMHAHIDGLRCRVIREIRKTELPCEFGVGPLAPVEHITLRWT